MELPVRSVRKLNRVPLGRHHVAVLLQVTSEPAPYHLLLAVNRKGSRDASFIVTSEVNALAGLGGMGSHFLCTLGEGGLRANYGASDDWAHPDLFLPAALGHAASHVGVTPPTTPVSGKGVLSWLRRRFSGR